MEYISNIKPQEAPTVHRFGIQEDLYKVIASAGFSEISITEFTFQYYAGTFEEYWDDYMSTTAASIRSKVEGKGEQIVSAMRSKVEEKVQQFVKDGQIHFPWQVLIATAICAQD